MLKKISLTTSVLFMSNLGIIDDSRESPPRREPPDSIIRYAKICSILAKIEELVEK